MTDTTTTKFAPTWRKVTAAILDFVTIMFVGGYVIGYLTGNLTEEGFSLKGGPAFILFAVSIVVHIYLGTAALPGTFQSMTRGTVTKSYARLHHPRWYRETTGDRSGT